MLGFLALLFERRVVLVIILVLVTMLGFLALLFGFVILVEINIVVIVDHSAALGLFVVVLTTFAAGQRQSLNVTQGFFQSLQTHFLGNRGAVQIVNKVFEFFLGQRRTAFFADLVLLATLD